MISEFYEEKHSIEFGKVCVTMENLISEDQPENTNEFFSIFQDKLKHMNKNYYSKALAYYNNQP